MSTNKNNPTINPEEIIITTMSSWKELAKKSGKKLMSGASVTLFGYELGKAGNEVNNYEPYNQYNKFNPYFPQNSFSQTYAHNDQNNTTKNEEMSIREIFIYSVIVFLIFFIATATKTLFMRRTRRREPLNIVDDL